MKVRFFSQLRSLEALHDARLAPTPSEQSLPLVRTGVGSYQCEASKGRVRAINVNHRRWILCMTAHQHYIWGAKTVT